MQDKFEDTKRVIRRRKSKIPKGVIRSRKSKIPKGNQKT